MRHTEPLMHGTGGVLVPDRMIRASICTSDTLNELSDFEERFWHRLIVNCDDFGRFDARPAILKGSLFPLADGKTKKDMADALNKLASVGLVELYTVDGKPFLHVVTWSKYQRTRATKSKFPSPDNTCCQLSSNAPVIEDEDESDNRKSKTKTKAENDPAVAAVMSAYMDRINPNVSEQLAAEMLGFIQVMGQECCLRAIQIAQDERKTQWSYVRGILRAKQAQGVRCLADWDAIDAERERRKQSGGHSDDGGSQNPGTRLPGIYL